MPVTSVSSSAWYMPICSGVIAEWSSSSIWSGSSAAIIGSALVRRNTRMPLSARIASSASTRVVLPSLDRRAMNCGRGPTRPGLAKSRIAQRSPRPFSIGVPVSAMRLRAGMRRSCCDVSLAGFLIACASSSTTRAHSHLGERVDVADRRAVGGDDDVGVGDLGRDLVGARAPARRGARPRAARA